MQQNQLKLPGETTVVVQNQMHRCQSKVTAEKKIKIGVEDLSRLIKEFDLSQLSIGLQQMNKSKAAVGKKLVVINLTYQRPCAFLLQEANE